MGESPEATFESKRSHLLRKRRKVLERKMGLETMLWKRRRASRVWFCFVEEERKGVSVKTKNKTVKMVEGRTESRSSSRTSS